MMNEVSQVYVPRIPNVSGIHMLLKRSMVYVIVNLFDVNTSFAFLLIRN